MNPQGASTWTLSVGSLEVTPMLAFATRSAFTCHSQGRESGPTLVDDGVVIANGLAARR